MHCYVLCIGENLYLSLHVFFLQKGRGRPHSQHNIWFHIFIASLDAFSILNCGSNMENPQNNYPSTSIFINLCKDTNFLEQFSLMEKNVSEFNNE